MYIILFKNVFIIVVNVVIVLFIGFIFYRRKFDKIGIISSLVVFIGIGIFFLEVDFFINFGDFLIFICLFGFVFYIFFISEFVKDNNLMVLIVI